MKKRGKYFIVIPPPKDIIKFDKNNKWGTYFLKSFLFVVNSLITALSFSEDYDSSSVSSFSIRAYLSSNLNRINPVIIWTAIATVIIFLI